eukprot:g44263.t1
MGLVKRTEESRTKWTPTKGRWGGEGMTSDGAVGLLVAEVADDDALDAEVDGVVFTGDGDGEVQEGEGDVGDGPGEFEVRVKGVRKVDQLFKLLIGARDSANTLINVAEEVVRDGAGVILAPVTGVIAAPCLKDDLTTLPTPTPNWWKHKQQIVANPNLKKKYCTLNSKEIDDLAQKE